MIFGSHAARWFTLCPWVISLFAVHTMATDLIRSPVHSDWSGLSRTFGSLDVTGPHNSPRFTSILRIAPHLRFTSSRRISPSCRFHSHSTGLIATMVHFPRSGLTSEGVHSSITGLSTLTVHTSYVGLTVTTAHSVTGTSAIGNRR